MTSQPQYILWIFLHFRGYNLDFLIEFILIKKACIWIRGQGRFFHHVDPVIQPVNQPTTVPIVKPSHDSSYTHVSHIPQFSFWYQCCVDYDRVYVFFSKFVDSSLRNTMESHQTRNTPATWIPAKSRAVLIRPLLSNRPGFELGGIIVSQGNQSSNGESISRFFSTTIDAILWIIRLIFRVLFYVP